MTEGPFSLAPDGVRVSLRLTPKAARARLGGLRADADGRLRLKASVTAVPEGGKANAALIRLLSKAWRVPGSDIAVVAGAADRNKTLAVFGDPAQTLSRLTGWLKEEGDR